MSTISFSQFGSAYSNTAAEALAWTTMDHRIAIAREYNPVITSHGIAMLELKKNGDCTIIDPRACLHYYDCSADLACNINSHISYEYFLAMIANQLIVNQETVWLRCIINATYIMLTVKNRVRNPRHTYRTVEDMMRSLRNEQGNCRTGVEMLTLDFIFCQPTSIHRRFKKCRDGSKKNPTITTPFIISEKRMQHRVMQLMTIYECQRALRSEIRKDRLAAKCRPGTKKDEGEGRPAVPNLVIEAEWMLEKDVGLSSWLGG